MSLAANLAGQFARMALVAPALARLKRNATRGALSIGLFAALAGFGLAYLLIALARLLERQIGPLWSPFAIGGVLCLAALVSYLALLRPRGPASARASEAAALPPELAAPLRDIERKVAKNPLPSLAVALAAGFAAAALLRAFRRREYPASPWPPRADGTERAGEARFSSSERPPWMREVLSRETERRKGNGRGA